MTTVLGRDKGVSVGGAEAGRHNDLRSRSGLLKLVSRSGVLRSRPRAGCLSVSRPVHTQHARDMRTLCGRPGLVRTVYTTRPGAVHYFVHCSGHCFRSLFMDTVHEHCS